MRTPQIVMAPIGTDRPAMSIPGTDQIRGMFLDNPSGSWLFVQPGSTFVPPYTIGVALTFPGGVTAVSIAFTDGPAGQISTQIGDPPVVQFDTEPVGTSSGVPAGNSFVDRSRQPEWTTATETQVINFGVADHHVVLGANADRRIRLLSLELKPATGDCTTPVRIFVNQPIWLGVANAVGVMEISHNRPIHRMEFIPPYDLQPNELLVIDGTLPNGVAGDAEGYTFVATYARV